MANETQPLLPGAPPTLKNCADYLEGFIDCFIDLVVFLSQKELQALFVATCAEMAFDLANAHALIRLVHNIENVDDPKGCVSIETIRHNTLICWGIFVACNPMEIRKAYSIIGAVKRKILKGGCGPIHCCRYITLNKYVSRTLRKGMEYVFVGLGTATRMAGTFSAFVVATQTILGAQADHPKPCYTPPGWSWVTASIVASIIGVYKGMWLSGFARAEALQKFFLYAYGLARNGSILTDHIVALILAKIQAATLEENMLDNIWQQLLWLGGVVIVSGVFMLSQAGLHHHDKKIREERQRLTGHIQNESELATQLDIFQATLEPHTILLETESWLTRLAIKTGAIVGATGVAALTTTAIDFISQQGDMDTPRHPAQQDTSLQWFVYIFFGSMVFAYYLHRFMLGLANW